MGNKNTKPNTARSASAAETTDHGALRPTSSAEPILTPLGFNNLTLQEDILCHICEEPLEDPISIACGHTFCSICLSASWSISLQDGYYCPQCNERIPWDTCIQQLVEKIGKITGLNVINDLSMEKAPEASENPRQSSVLNRNQNVMLPQASETRWHGIQGIMELSPTQLQSVVPLQLVCLDENEKLHLDENILSFCLEQGEVKDAHVCLITIFGKHRLGKSFLLNFLRRRFHNMAAMDESWMGKQDEPLEGFEWNSRHESITKGLWIWSQPFWVHSVHGKVAVFLVDTEGLMDLERDKEVGVKISAFSMLLSSYQIFNLGPTKDDTDLEYLDMFVHAAEIVGDKCGLKPIQHLDILVRDWTESENHGFQAGQAYLRDIFRKLRGCPNKHSRAQAALRSNTTTCYVMPHPGKELLKPNKGTLANMEGDFMEHMKIYINKIYESVGNHLKRDQHGMALTGGQLAAKIKSFSDFMKKCDFGFSSVRQMAIAIHMQKINNEFKEFINKQDLNTFSPVRCLKVKPMDMKLELKKQMELVTSCEEHLRGDRESLKTLRLSLEGNANHFLKKYGHRYKRYKGYQYAVIGAVVLACAGGGIVAGSVGALMATQLLLLGVGTSFSIGSITGMAAGGFLGGVIGRLKGRKQGQRMAQEAQDIEMQEFTSQSRGDSGFGEDDEHTPLL